MSAHACLDFFPCPELFLPLPPPVGEFFSLTWILFLCQLILPFVLSSGWAPLTFSDYFCVLTHPSLCALQHVSSACPLGFIYCPNLPASCCSLGSEFPLLTGILSLSWLVSLSALQDVSTLCLLWLYFYPDFFLHPSILSREWVASIWLQSFCVLTWPSPLTLQRVSDPLLCSLSICVLTSPFPLNPMLCRLCVPLSFLISLNRLVSYLGYCQHVSCLLILACFLCPHFFPFLHHRFYTSSWRHFLPKYYHYFAVLFLFNWHTFSHLSSSPAMTIYITS